jgi:DNA end-binding protein Ku
LIRRKAKGKTIETPEPPEKTDNVINLMDALQQSLGPAQTSLGKAASRPAGRLAFASSCFSSPEL